VTGVVSASSCAIFEFWQNAHVREHPFGPMEYRVDPGGGDPHVPRRDQHAPLVAPGPADAGLALTDLALVRAEVALRHAGIKLLVIFGFHTLNIRVCPAGPPKMPIDNASVLCYYIGMLTIRRIERRERRDS
jgi:hypothetical protein